MADAWQHVYRLLLWIDRTIGLAHCHESDKSQPGRPWYPRSLAYHAWLSHELGVTPDGLADAIDYLFRHASEDLAAALVHRDPRTAAAADQRAPYDGQGFPEPGEDPELRAILRDTLAPYLVRDVPDDVWQVLVRRITAYMAQENKRKNLVGEGFEDVLAALIVRCGVAAQNETYVRRKLDDLPGFHPTRRGEKPTVVDLAVMKGPRQRILASIKWSVRADREEQFRADYDDYIRAETENRPFDYVLITNEFDPARLKRACDLLERNAPMFTSVVHINTDALSAVYGERLTRSQHDVMAHIDSGRLISLGAWLSLLRQ